MSFYTLSLLALALAPDAAPKGAAPNPVRAVQAAALDAARLPKAEARYFRYLWLCGPESERENDLITLAFHSNLLSDQGTFGPLVLVAPHLVRLDTRDFGWDKRLAVWERFAELDPYFHLKLKALEDISVDQAWPGGKETVQGKDYEPGVYDKKVKAGQQIARPAPWLPQKDINFLRYRLKTEAPVLRADWHFVQTCRAISIRNKDEKVGYYEWVGIAKREDLFKLAGLDEKKAISIYREWRALVERSGISQQGRQIVALGSTSGIVWGTLDTDDQTGRGQLKRNLRRGEFLHKAEEWYFHLPNRLPGTGLFDNEGKVQATAPDFIGPDDSPLRVGKDARVHSNLSCMRCHAKHDQLQPVNDWARRAFKNGVLRLVDKDKKVVLELKSQYLRDLERILKRDREEYSDAIREVTATKGNPKGLTSEQAGTLYGKFYNRYVEETVTLEVAARELGCTPLALKAALVRYAKRRGQADLVLSAFLEEPPGELSRLEWEDGTYQLAMFVLLGVDPPEKLEKLEVKR